MILRTIKISLCSLAIATLFSATAYAEKNSDEVTLTFLETNDVHGRLTEYNYSTGEIEKCGLTRCATVIKRQRELDPNLILVDCGDTTQGNLVSEFRLDPVHPAIKALNFLKYDAWELGNHEFNFEFSSLQNNIKNFKGIVLGGNIYKTDGTRFVYPYFVKEIKGVKVAVIGLEAPHIPIWESDKSHYDNMKFTNLSEELEKILGELEKEAPDVVVALCHYGENGEKGAKGMYEIAKIYSKVGNSGRKKIDAFLIGHSHNTLSKYLNGENWEDYSASDNSTIIMQTGSNAKNVGKLTLTVKKDISGVWKVESRNIEMIDCGEAEPDPELSEILKDYHIRSLKKANTVIGKVTEDFIDDPYWLGYIPRVAISDVALMDFINDVQIENSGADISFAGVLDKDSSLNAGPFCYKDIRKIYRYDNTLIKLKVTGAQVKQAMENHIGNFFNGYQPGDVTYSFNPDMNLYEFDTVQGLDYEIDLTQPKGHRIVNILYKGKPLTVDTELTMVCNSYRFGQFKDEGIVKDSDVIFNSSDWAKNSTISDMIADYVIKKGEITPKVSNNWRIKTKLEDPQAEQIYQMIRAGKIDKGQVEKRGLNSESINANKLRADKVI